MKDKLCMRALSKLIIVPSVRIYLLYHVLSIIKTVCPSVLVSKKSYVFVNFCLICSSSSSNPLPLIFVVKFHFHFGICLQSTPIF